MGDREAKGNAMIFFTTIDDNEVHLMLSEADISAMRRGEFRFVGPEHLRGGNFRKVVVTLHDSDSSALAQMRAAGHGAPLQRSTDQPPRDQPLSFGKAVSDEDRWQWIGRWCETNPGRRAAVCVDDEPGKPERYRDGIKAKFPALTVEIVGKRPMAGVVSLTVVLENKTESG